MDPDDLPFALREEEEESDGVEASDQAPAPEEESSELSTAQTEAMEQIAREEGWFLPKTNTAQAFEKLIQEDPELRNRFHSEAGRRAAQQARRIAAREFEPQIEDLKRQLYEAQMRANQLVIQSTPEDQVAERIKNDPQFRKAYMATLEGNAPPPVDPSAREIRLAIDSAMEQAELQGLPPERVAAYWDAIARGMFDRDGAGNPLTRAESLVAFQQALFNEVQALQQQRLQSRQATAPAPTPTPATAPKAQAEAKPAEEKPKGNPRLAGGPDLTQGGSTSGSAGFSKEEIDRMTPEQLLKHFPWSDDGEDLADLVKAGRVKGYDL